MSDAIDDLPSSVLRELLRKAIAELDEAKIENVDLAFATATKWAKAVKILRVVAQRTQSTNGNEEDVTAIYRSIIEALDALSGKGES